MCHLSSITSVFAWMQASYACSKETFLPDLWQACDTLYDLLQAVAETLQAKAASINSSSRSSKVYTLYTLYIHTHAYIHHTYIHAKAASINASSRSSKVYTLYICVCVYVHTHTHTYIYIYIHKCQSILSACMNISTNNCQCMRPQHFSKGSQASSRLPNGHTYLYTYIICV